MVLPIRTMHLNSPEDAPNPDGLGLLEPDDQIIIALDFGTTVSHLLRSHPKDDFTDPRPCKMVVQRHCFCF